MHLFDFFKKKKTEDISADSSSSISPIHGKTTEDAAGVGVVATNKKMAKDPRYSTSITKDVKPTTPKNMLRAFRLAEAEVDEAWSNKYKRSIDCNNPKGFSQKAHCAARRARKSGKQTRSKPVTEAKDKQVFIDILKKFLPIVKKELELDRLPKIKIQSHVTTQGGQATFGRFVNDEEIIYLGIADRHPLDVIRTLAHELVHWRQYLDGRIKPGSGETGSPIENEAHAVAGVIMRKFNKEFPDAIKLTAIQLQENKDFVKKNIQYHDELNPAAWTTDQELKPEVRQKLLKIADIFVNYLDIPDFEVKDIVLTGSMANYNWTRYSDFDLHVITDYADLKCDDLSEPFYKAKKKIWNDRHNITIRGYDVELYVEDINTPPVSTGIFSILNNKWIKKPNYSKPDISHSAINTKVADLINQIKNAVDSQDQAAEIQKIKDKLRKMRRAGLDTAGEFSTENLAYKILRNLGILDQINKIQTQHQDRELSIKEATVNSKYVYHASYLPDLGKGLNSIAKKGLLPSIQGQMGTGVYFSYTPEGGFYHVDPSDATMIRVPWDKLVKLYGLYPDTLNGIERDDEQIIVPGAVPPEIIEVEYFKDEWWPVKDAAAAESQQALDENTHPFKVPDIIIDTIKDTVPETLEIWLHGSRATGKARPDSDTDILVIIPDDIVGEKYLQTVLSLQQVGNRFPGYDIQPSKIGTVIYRIAREEGTRLWEDQHPNEKPRGPETKPTMPKGTVRVDVSDVYDWYKLGQHISDMKGLGKHDFGKGPPSTILSFGDEDLEHEYIKDLERTGLTTTDIDPKMHDQKKGQKVDPTFNVTETIRKQGGKYIIYSHDGSKRLGSYDSRSAAEKRLRQIEYFKHVKENFSESQIEEVIDPSSKYMSGHCHVMALALKKLHPDWQIRAHIGWDDQAEDNDDYRIDHVYVVAPDGSAYDCRGKFDNEEELVGPDETGGVETQFVDYDAGDIKNDISRGELKHFSQQDLLSAIKFARAQGLEENFADGKIKGKSRPGRVKRAGASCKGSVTDLRAKAKKAGGERGKMYHWCANMKAGKKK